MKFFYLILLFSYGSYASTEECINKSDVDSLIGVFKNNDKQSLINFSSDAIKGDVEQDELILNKKSTLVNMSEVYYGWGVDKNSKYPMHSSPVFPGERVCVWNISFALPESMRKKCDDDGAYGYFIDFKKDGGKLSLYRFTSLFDALPDGTLACKAANKFMFPR